MRRICGRHQLLFSQMREHLVGLARQSRLMSLTSVEQLFYVVFFERDTLLQGNFYEAKKFIHGPLSRIFFDALGFDSLMGKAVWSSNSEVRNSKARETDWRDSKRTAYYESRNKKVPVSGLQKFYLLCGFVFLNQIIGNNWDSKDQMVLLNPNKYGDERNKLNKNFSFDINKISTPLEEEITLIS